MDFTKASKQQLLTILQEDCSIHYKYRAAFELQSRKERAASQKVTRFKGKAAYTDKVYRVTV